jgi:hypothetical protein
LDPLTECGVDLSAPQLVEKYHVPPPVVETERVFLSRAPASNVAVLRAARVEAAQEGLPLEVESLEAAFGPSIEASGVATR